MGYGPFVGSADMTNLNLPLLRRNITDFLCDTMRNLGVSKTHALSHADSSVILRPLGLKCHSRGSKSPTPLSLPKPELRNPHAPARNRRICLNKRHINVSQYALSKINLGFFSFQSHDFCGNC